MTPAAPVKIDTDVQCFKGERSRSTSIHRTLNPPAVDRFRPNIARAEDCTVFVAVDGKGGKLKAELFVKRRR